MNEKTPIRLTNSGKTDRCPAVGHSGRKLPFRLGEPMIPRMPHVRRTLLLLVALVFAWPVLADYYDGLRHWEAGSHGEALVEWQETAMEGDACSMMALGRLFVQGPGPQQDYIEAHKWFNLAASRGVEEAFAERGDYREDDAGSASHCARTRMGVRLAYWY